MVKRHKSKLVVPVGPPGCGKGTLCRYLIEKFPELFHLEIGALFRNPDESFAHIVEICRAQFVSLGLLVPDDYVFQILSHFFGAVGERSILMDGFPRSVPQAEYFLREIVPKFDSVTVLELCVPDEECLARMSGRGRPDDSKSLVRLKEYGYHTGPAIGLVQKYLPKDCFLRVSAHHPGMPVEKEVAKTQNCIFNLLSPRFAA